MTNQISFTLDYTEQGTDTINVELIEYRTPAVIIQAEPAEPTIDELEEASRNSWYGSAESHAIDEKLAALKKWKAEHRYEIRLVEEDDTLQQYLDGDENAHKPQAIANTADALRDAPDWIDRNAEKGRILEEISWVLKCLYNNHLAQFEDIYLPNHHGISLDEYRRAPEALKNTIFGGYWDWF